MITFSKIGSFGRLGNQLFQIAAAIGLAKTNNDSAKFYEWEYAKFFKFPVDQSLNKSEIVNTIHESGFNYSPLNYIINSDLIGYFQSEKYFEHCKDLIRYHFEFVDDILDVDDINKYSEFCSIHIRRGDYLNISQYHPIQPMKYYMDSVSIMESNGYNNFLIFSDDIEWCKKKFKDTSKFYFSEGRSNIQDLYLMSKCGSNIIANSSFSWWGAWLNKNANKKIIAPSLWFGEAKSGCNTDDIYCKEWIII